MFEKLLLYIIEEHRGKALGVLLGLIAGILFVTLGFWKAFFVIICILLGYTWGKKMDDNGNLDSWINKLFRKQ